MLFGAGFSYRGEQASVSAAFAGVIQPHRGGGLDIALVMGHTTLMFSSRLAGHREDIPTRGIEVVGRPCNQAD
jgi:hypothetical protein